MPIMVSEAPITLKEVKLRLGVPQHVLIHLCEKGVIVPDFTETEGRGKRREFSQRNLFEFATALALRELELPVAVAAFVVRLTRSFERAMAKLVPGFVLPATLAERDLHLDLHLYDGRTLVFEARGKSLPKPLLLAAPMQPANNTLTRPRLDKLDALPTDFDARIHINLTRIAQRMASTALPK